MLKKFKTKTATAAKERRFENVRGLLRMVCKAKVEAEGEREGWGKEEAKRGGGRRGR